MQHPTHASNEQLSIQIIEHPAEQPLLGEPLISGDRTDRNVAPTGVARSPRSPRLSSSEIAVPQTVGGQPSSPSSMSMAARERQEYEMGIADPQIRQIWAEAVDLNQIRNVEDQTEFGVFPSITLKHYF